MDANLVADARASLARSFRTAAEEQLMPAVCRSSTDGQLVQAREEGAVLAVDCKVPSGNEWALKMSVLEGIRVVAHGHSAAFWLDDMQLAELHVDSTSAAIISVCESSPGNQQIVLEGHGGELRIDLRLGAFLLKDRGVGRPGLGWRRHQSRRSLNYLLDSPVPGRSPAKLLVVFSAIGAERDFTFNYRATVEGRNLSKVFVLDDFGHQGSYYWVDHGDDSIFSETQILLAKLVQELNVDLRDVMFAGSSKGGTAALLHGVTLGVGRVLVGAPQYRVGDYLLNAAPRILDFMTGEASDESRQSLNERAREILFQGQRRTTIRVAVGSSDHHLVSHVIPLTEDARAAGYSVSSLVLPGVPHSKIGWVFKHLLAVETLDLELGTWQDPLPYALSRNNERATLRCWPAEGETLAVHLFGKTAVLEKRPYSEDVEFTFVLPVNAGPVRARVFRRHGGGSAVHAFTTHWV